MLVRFKAVSLAAVAFSTLVAFGASDASVAGEISGIDAGGTPATRIASPLPVPASATPSAQPDLRTPDVAVPIKSEPVKSDFATPPSHGAKSLAQLVGTMPVAAALEGEMRCLASAVYYEAKGESFAGQLAVARVVINRARSGRFASSLCGVVLQPGQFSFVRGRNIPTPSLNSRDWQEAAAIAQIAQDQSWSENPAEGALFFHARRVSPGWKLRRIAAIDNHVFYR